MDTDILITGGSLSGTSLALALASAGHKVTLIDSLPNDAQLSADFDGRAYAIALGSQKLLKAIDLWEALSPKAQAMKEIKVSDGRAGQGPLSPFFLHFDQGELDEGPMGYMVEDRHLRPALLDAVTHMHNITHLPGETVTAQEVGLHNARVTLSSGKTLTGKVLIGADGRKSGTAQRAGIGRMVSEYGQTALVAAIAHEKPHNGIAHQFFMPAGPLAILPLTENRSSIVWSEKSDHAAHVLNLPQEAFLDHLRPRFGSFLGEISLAGQRFSYPLNLTLAKSMIAARVALVADAAHGMHPIAGQGLNAGLRDVAALAQVLTDAARRGEDIGSPLVLETYQRWRRFDIATLALATDSFNRLFSNDNALLRSIRGLGMGLVQSLPPLRQGFMREAAGQTGDLPRLMMGAAL
jgi:2-octaprenyl-6-methoxyphenol hydroxylase